MNAFPPDDYPDWPVSWIEHTQLLLDSFAHFLGHELVQRGASPVEDAATVFNAPFVVVSHGVESDPVLSYANRVALELWEMDIPTLLATPSRLTAEPVHRSERAKLLQRTTANGFVDDYQGIRISRTGKRFRIDQAIVWNLRNAEGGLAGQAATFADWHPL